MRAMPVDPCLPTAGTRRTTSRRHRLRTTRRITSRRHSSGKRRSLLESCPDNGRKTHHYLDRTPWRRSGAAQGPSGGGGQQPSKVVSTLTLSAEADVGSKV